jgi:hypothetical protein
VFVARENIFCTFKCQNLIAKTKKNLCFTKKKFGRIDWLGKAQLIALISTAITCSNIFLETFNFSCAHFLSVSLQCGQTSSENCTYLTLSSASSTTLPTNCVYTLCECNPNICRLRLDFMVRFTIRLFILKKVSGKNTTLANKANIKCKQLQFSGQLKRLLQI